MREPIFHHPDHLEQYDSHYVRLQGAEIELVLGELDEVLFAHDSLSIGTRKAHATKDTSITTFRHQYPDFSSETADIPEQVSLSVDHTIYLGKCIVQQTYKVMVETYAQGFAKESNGGFKILQAKHRTSYYFEEVVGDESMPYFGTILRPHVLDTLPEDEPITVYDCLGLYDVVIEIRSHAAQVVREMRQNG